MTQACFISVLQLYGSLGMFLSKLLRCPANDIFSTFWCIERRPERIDGLHQPTFLVLI